ncbi:MAG: hypothetical protein ABFC96_13720 [Thermoguttaceae bacterium]
MRLVSARLGEDDIPWSVSARRVTLTLPEPIREGERVIRLGAIGAIAIDRPWRLPQIRCPQVSWQQGDVTLLVPEPLLVNRLTPRDCAQTDATPLGSPRKGQSFAFQCFAPEATVELLLACVPAGGPATDAASPAAESQVVHRLPESSPRASCAGAPRPRHVEDCRLRSWCQADGSVRHVARYQLAGVGGRHIELTCPPGLLKRDVRSVQCDGAPVAWQWIDDDGASRIAIAMPRGRRPYLAVEWTAAAQRVGMFGSLTAVAPRPDLPVLDRRWTVFLPPGYESLTASNDRSGASIPPRTWSQRLFGPLGRPSDAARFNPFSAESWARLGAVFSPAAATSETWRTELSARGSTAMMFVDGRSMQFLGCLVLLATVAIGCSKLGRRKGVLPCLLAFFAAAALILPSPCVAPATGGVLGSLFCLLWRWIGTWRAVPRSAGWEDKTQSLRPRTSPDSTVSTRLPSAMLLLATLLSACGGSVANAEGPPVSDARQSGEQTRPTASSATSEPQRDFAILVPINAKRQPVGKKVYLPEPFYQELHRRALAAERPGWMIAGATYRAELVREASGSLAMSELRVECNLRVFDRAARIQLPFDTAAADLLPGSLRLDGQPVELESNESVRNITPQEPAMFPFSLLIDEPGTHRLQFSLRLASPTADGFSLPVPRLPTARLELALPDDSLTVEVPSALGRVKRASSGAGRRLLADLGPSDHLTVQWREPDAIVGGPPAIDADQLLWLTVRPGSVTIAARFRLRVTKGQTDRVRLTLDPRLRLLPLAGDNPPSVQVGPESGASRPITFRWSRPLAGETTLEAAFLLSGASGVGNLRLPQIEMSDAQIATRWMAVSIDAALDRQEQHLEGFATLPIADFLRSWNAGRAPGGSTPPAPAAMLGGHATIDPRCSRGSNPAPLRPQAAYRLPAGPIGWMLSTRPHEPHRSINQTLSLSFASDKIDLAFDGRLSVPDDYVFQHRLATPRGLKIQHVSILEGDVERALRWVQDGDTLTIFLSGAASGEQRISIRGQLPNWRAARDANGAACKYRLPSMRVENCQVRLGTIHLFRRPGVMLTVDAPASRTASAPPASRLAPADFGALAATIPCDGSGAPITVTASLDRSAGANAARPSAPTESDHVAASPGTSERGQTSEPDPFRGRLAVAVAMLLATVAAVIALSNDRFRRLCNSGVWKRCTSRPALAGVLLGLAWWLWLSPSAVGLLVALASAAGAVRRRAA